MDIQTLFIFISSFSVASVLLIFIYKFGIKEKSYEEALAEQRQQTHSLLGVKPKSSKEKKNKKSTKKVQQSIKEKSVSVENDDKEEETEQSKNVEMQKKPHVEFKDIIEDVNVKNVESKKQTKKDKVRPILVHKEDSLGEIINTEKTVSLTNHFEELHPKDDYELLRSSSVEDPAKELQRQISKSTVTKEEDHKQVTKATAKVEPQKQIVQIETEPPKENNEKTGNPPFIVTPTIINGIIANTGKEKKKKKSEINTLKQLGVSNGPNITVLLELLRKAELSRSEVQILIDLLLNKQHDSPAILDDWSEGKTDPVQKLKKQLAEKEKLLSEEQQIVAGAQAKLREVRLEYQNEKTVLQQKIRSLETIIDTKQIEATRSHQQVQQLQTQIKDELMKYHTLREEHAMQRQRYEVHLSQAQESEVRIGQLQSEVQEMSSVNRELTLKLTHITKEAEENNKTYFVQLNNFQKDLDQQNERNRQLEETRLKMEKDVEHLLRNETDLNKEISHLNSVIQQKNEETRRLELNLKNIHDDLQKQKDECNKLTVELRQAQEENLQFQMQQMNDSSQKNEQYEVEILNLRVELSSVKSKLNQEETKREKANAIAETLRQEIEDLKLKFDKEKLKLDEQKLKNNELRTKNWKVMEALNAAESKLKNTSSIKCKSEEDIQREFVQRLFPEIRNIEITNPEVFKTEGEKFITNYVVNLKRHNIQLDEDCNTHQLKLQLQHYKNVIDDTEKMLNKLQKHIEQEEINWRMQLTAKTTELESIKANQRQESHKRNALETELKKEQEEKKLIIAQLQQFNSHAQGQNLSYCLQ